jgi:hypothetical protein
MGKKESGVGPVPMGRPTGQVKCIYCARIYSNSFFDFDAVVPLQRSASVLAQEDNDRLSAELAFENSEEESLKSKAGRSAVR